MFTKFSKSNLVLSSCSRYFSKTIPKNIQVTVIGGTGGVGRSSLLLLKHNPMISQINVFGIEDATCGIALDLSHVESKVKVCAFIGSDDKTMEDSLKGSRIVCMTAAAPISPELLKGGNRNHLEYNAPIMEQLCRACARVAPGIIMAIVTNPINSMVPYASELMKQHGCYDPRKIIGVTTLDVTRANVFVGKFLGTNPLDINVPVIGAHSTDTIIPLFSMATPPFSCSEDDLIMLTKKVQKAGIDVFIAHDQLQTSQLAMAYALARFIFALTNGLSGTNMVECAYVRSTSHPEARYFATPVMLGRHGVEKSLGIPKISRFERDLVAKCIPMLQKDIQQGEDAANKGAGGPSNSGSKGTGICADGAKISDKKLLLRPRCPIAIATVPITVTELAYPKLKWMRKH